MPALSYGDCRDAARAVKQAEHGPAAIARLRGERIAFQRQRPGLAMLLYVAAAQGRLVWRSPTCFALLAPPLDLRGQVGISRWGRALGRLENGWPYLRDSGPAVLLLAVAPLALLAGRYQLLLIALISALVTLYAVVIVAAIVTRGLLGLLRTLDGWTRPERTAWEQLLVNHWSLALCHAEEDADVEALLREAVAEARALAEHTEYDASTLLCVRSGMTTDHVWSKVTEETAAVPEVDDAVRVMRTPGDRVPTPGPERGVRGVVVFLCFIPLMTLLAAWMLVEEERKACGGSGCTGGLTDYADAALWLLGKALLVGGLSDATPTTMAGRAAGVSMQLLGRMTILVVATAGWRAARAGRAANNMAKEALTRSLTESQRSDFGGVFVNYRRGPHQGAVNAIRRELANRFSDDKVFMDRRSIEAGGRYPDELRAALARSEVLLAVIHPAWLTQLLERRRTGETDWVFDEILTAFEAKITVIPVYLDETDWLKADELPEEIGDLAHRQGRHVRYATNDLDGDLDILLAAVERAALSRMGGSRG